MKKILSVIVALVAFAGIANAQVNITKSEHSRAKQMTTLAMSWSWIYQADDLYFIVMKSDNQFDDSFWLSLGSTKDECIETILDLIDLAKDITEDDWFNVDNGVGEVFDVSLYKIIGVRGLQFHGDDYAGSAYITAQNLNKALKWIESNL